MNMSKALIAAALLVSLSYARRSSAAQWCEFHASDSIYYNTSYASIDIYANGPISFVWEPETGDVLSGYYTEQVIYYDPVETYFADVTSGTIVSSMDPTQDPELSIAISSMSFVSTVPVYDAFSLEDGTITGTSSAANFQGYLDGPFLIEATGTVVCN